MVAIAASWQVGTQPEDGDVPMEDAADDELAPPSSSASLLVHATLASALHHYHRRGPCHYLYMVREEQFREAQVDATYNHQLLQEHLQEEEQLAAGRAVARSADMVE